MLPIWYQPVSVLVSGLISRATSTTPFVGSVLLGTYAVMISLSLVDWIDCTGFVPPKSLNATQVPVQGKGFGALGICSAVGVGVGVGVGLGVGVDVVSHLGTLNGVCATAQVLLTL